MESAGRPTKCSKRKRETPESEFCRALLECAKSNDFQRALSLYNSNSFRLSASQYNTLLHLISSAVEDSVVDEAEKQSTIEIACKVFNEMIAGGAVPNEATITTMARIASQKSTIGPENAFEMVKSMGEKYNATPRLRTFVPALFGFCRMGQADKAYEVEAHMGKVQIVPEEQELAALLDVSIGAGREDKVYEYLHKIRSSVRCVSESTAAIIEKWFKSEKAVDVGIEVDIHRIREETERNGEGWHGLGWLGRGTWKVNRVNLSDEGVCSCCKKCLVCVDIDERETEKFAESIAALAMQRKGEANFRSFQDWLENHATYEAVIDGANIGFYQQNFEKGGFSLSQLDSVVRELRGTNQSKWPLIILHSKRVRDLMDNPSHRELINKWTAEGALYKTPYGSNDDWYWLYAAVKLKCLVITNDEMRDHIFELLGRSFFPKWKEGHQVRYTFVKGTLKLVMHPPYSVIIQESDTGSWHVPIDGNCNDEHQRVWLCITRA